MARIGVYTFSHRYCRPGKGEEERAVWHCRFGGDSPILKTHKLSPSSLHPDDNRLPKLLNLLPNRLR